MHTTYPLDINHIDVCNLSKIYNDACQVLSVLHALHMHASCVGDPGEAGGLSRRPFLSPPPHLVQVCVASAARSDAARTR